MISVGNALNNHFKKHAEHKWESWQGPEARLSSRRVAEEIRMTKFEIRMNARRFQIRELEFRSNFDFRVSSFSYQFSSISFEERFAMELTWLGHATWLLKTGSHTILLDPFLDDSPTAPIKSDKVAADFILVSHGHGDHIADCARLPSEPAHW